MGDTGAAVVCSLCGTAGDCAPGAIPPGWSILTEEARLQYVCVTCSRANLRAIEGKLPTEYWE